MNNSDRRALEDMDNRELADCGSFIGSCYWGHHGLYMAIVIVGSVLSAVIITWAAPG